MSGFGETIFYGKDSYYHKAENRIEKNVYENNLKNTTPEVNRRHSEYYDKIKYLLIQLLVVGVLPVCKPGKGVKLRCFLVFLYCIPVYTAITAFCFVEFKRVYAQFKEKRNLELSMEQINRLITLSQQVTILVCIWPQSFYVTQNIQKWSEYQEQYESLTHQPFKLTKLNKVLIFSLFNIIVTSPIIGLYFYNNSQSIPDNIWHLVLYVYLTQIAIVLIQIWYFVSTAGETSADDLLQQLKKRFSKVISPGELQAYRLLWLKLSEVVCGAGSSLSIPIAHIVLAMFIEIVVNSYIITLNIITDIQNNDIDYIDTLKSFISQICVLTSLFIICQKGYTVTKCNHAIKRYLMGMQLPNNSLMNQATMAELRIFIRTVDVFPMEFSIRGFKLINKALLVGCLRGQDYDNSVMEEVWKGLQNRILENILKLIGDVVTYVIILVQFNLSLRSGPSITPPSTTNSTT